MIFRQELGGHSHDLLLIFILSRALSRYYTKSNMVYISGPKENEAFELTDQSVKNGGVKMNTPRLRVKILSQGKINNKETSKECLRAGLSAHKKPAQL